QFCRIGGRGIGVAARIDDPPQPVEAVPERRFRDEPAVRLNNSLISGHRVQRFYTNKAAIILQRIGLSVNYTKVTKRHYNPVMIEHSENNVDDCDIKSKCKRIASRLAILVSVHGRSAALRIMNWITASRLSKSRAADLRRHLSIFLRR